MAATLNPTGRVLCALLRAGNRAARAQVAFALNVHKGNAEAAGRALGISGQSIRNIVPGLVQKARGK